MARSYQDVDDLDGAEASLNEELESGECTEDEFEDELDAINEERHRREDLGPPEWAEDADEGPDEWGAQLPD
jgi:hypothetical protein